MAYSLRIKPGPPSPLRQLAYADNTPLLGPDQDPTGWKVLEPKIVSGKLFQNREVQIKCTVCPTCAFQRCVYLKYGDA